MGITENSATASAVVDVQVLKFYAERRLFCIPLSYVERVIQFVELQSVPDMPRYFKGLLNLHGNSVPVIDVGERLGFNAESIYTLDTPIILCQHEKSMIALIVEDVAGVETLHSSVLQMQELLQQNKDNYLKGSVSTTSGDALLIDMQTFFHLDVKKDPKVCRE